MDQNVIIALVIVGTVLLIIAVACCIRKSTDLQGEAIKTDYLVGKRSRRDRELEERIRNGGDDIRRALRPATPPGAYPILPPPPDIHPVGGYYPPPVGLNPVRVPDGWNQPWGRTIA